MPFFDRLRLWFWWLPFGRVPEINAVDLSQSLAGVPRPQLIDVRTHAEFWRGHIGGAVNVPLQELKGRLPSLALDRARPIVAICRSAHRSIPAVRLLQTRGFGQAVQLQGGMLAWRQSGLPVEGDDSTDSPG
jgi:rhodanese-related sulfurtransferase